jgi:hypothetical protein
MDKKVPKGKTRIYVFDSELRTQNSELSLMQLTADQKMA